MTYGETPRPEGDDDATDPASATPGASARDKARVLREAHRRRERRTRVMIGGGIAAAVLAVIAVVAVAIVAAIPAETGSPSGIVDGGIPVTAPAPTPQPTISTGPNAATVEPESVAVTVYTDYLCANCGVFNRTNAEQLRTLVNSGAATLSIHPLALLTGKSQGTQYSQRAANAMACVADLAPESVLDVNDALFAQQPAEGSTGLTDAQLADAASDAGVASVNRVRDCITSHHYLAWVKDVSSAAVDGPLAATPVDASSIPPLVLVDGQPYTGPVGDAASFNAFLVQAAGAKYNLKSTPTPTATP